MIPLANVYVQLAPYAWLVFCLCMFFIWLRLAIWVKDDASRRGQNGVVVALLVSLMVLPGIILWLVLRPALPLRSENSELESRSPPAERRPPRSPEHSRGWRIARADSREVEARVIDDAPSAADAELKAREYLRESPEAFVYVLNADGNRYRVIL